MSHQWIGLELADDDDLCGGCGACCTSIMLPPFDGFEPGVDDEFDDLSPELQAELTARFDALFGPGAEPLAKPEDLACCWFDLATRRCRHYEDRPVVCRRFQPGCSGCNEFRLEAGLPLLLTAAGLAEGAGDA